MDFSPVFHACAAVAVPCIFGLVWGNWASGAVLGCLWFVAREQTQAEYRWIAEFGGGHRANMPWWGGFDYRVWDLASVLDFAVPIVAVTVVWMIVRQ